MLVVTAPNAHAKSVKEDDRKHWGKTPRLLLLELFLMLVRHSRYEHLRHVDTVHLLERFPNVSRRQALGEQCKKAFPADLWPILAEAKQQLGILEGLGRNHPNLAILLRPLADREAIGSSRVVGTHATGRELLLFDLDPQPAASESDPAN